MPSGVYPMFKRGGKIPHPAAGLSKNKYKANGEEIQRKSRSKLAQSATEKLNTSITNQTELATAVGTHMISKLQDMGDTIQTPYEGNASALNPRTFGVTEEAKQKISAMKSLAPGITKDVDITMLPEWARQISRPLMSSATINDSDEEDDGMLTNNLVNSISDPNIAKAVMKAAIDPRMIQQSSSRLGKRMAGFGSKMRPQDFGEMAEFLTKQGVVRQRAKGGGRKKTPVEEAIKQTIEPPMEGGSEEEEEEEYVNPYQLPLPGAYPEDEDYEVESKEEEEELAVKETTINGKLYYEDKDFNLYDPITSEKVNIPEEKDLEDSDSDLEVSEFHTDNGQVYYMDENGIVYNDDHSILYNNIFDDDVAQGIKDAAMEYGLIGPVSDAEEEEEEEEEESKPNNPGFNMSFQDRLKAERQAEIDSHQNIIGSGKPSDKPRDELGRYTEADLWDDSSSDDDVSIDEDHDRTAFYKDGKIPIITAEQRNSITGLTKDEMNALTPLELFGKLPVELAKTVLTPSITGVRVGAYSINDIRLKDMRIDYDNELGFRQYEEVTDPYMRNRTASQLIKSLTPLLRNRDFTLIPGITKEESDFYIGLNDREPGISSDGRQYNRFGDAEWVREILQDDYPDLTYDEVDKVEQIHQKFSNYIDEEEDERAERLFNIWKINNKDKVEYDKKEFHRSWADFYHSIDVNQDWDFSKGQGAPKEDKMSDDALLALLGGGEEDEEDVEWDQLEFDDIELTPTAEQNLGEIDFEDYAPGEQISENLVDSNVGPVYVIINSEDEEGAEVIGYLDSDGSRDTEVRKAP
jgi:hypothetical protein